MFESEGASQAFDAEKAKQKHPSGQFFMNGKICIPSGLSSGIRCSSRGELNVKVYSCCSDSLGS